MRNEKARIQRKIVHHMLSSGGLREEGSLEAAYLLMQHAAEMIEPSA